MKDSAPARRLPDNYQLVHDIVRQQAAGAHTTPSAIYVEARRRQPRIGHATVYRALDRLRALGLILEVRVPGAASALYEPARSDHAHFLCDRCHRVEDIDYELSPEVLKGLAATRDVVITDVRLTFHGVCSACRGSARAEPGAA